MKSVEMVENVTVNAPRARLADSRGRPMIRVRRTAELNDALNALTTLGVQQLGYSFRFYDDGNVTWQFTGRRGAGRDKSVLPAIEAARQRLGELLEAAIREAAREFMGPDRELRYDCEASFRPGTGSWRLSGHGTAFEIDPDFFDVGLDLD